MSFFTHQRPFFKILGSNSHLHLHLHLHQPFVWVSFQSWPTSNKVGVNAFHLAPNTNTFEIQIHTCTQIQTHRHTNTNSFEVQIQIVFKYKYTCTQIQIHTCTQIQIVFKVGQPAIQLQRVNGANDMFPIAWTGSSRRIWNQCPTVVVTFEVIDAFPKGRKFLLEMHPKNPHHPHQKTSLSLWTWKSSARSSKSC